jgi:hypothetical protein
LLHWAEDSDQYQAFCECGDDPSGFINGVEFCEQLSACWVLNACAPCIHLYSRSLDLSIIMGIASGTDQKKHRMLIKYN